MLNNNLINQDNFLVLFILYSLQKFVTFYVLNKFRLIIRIK
ncbi:LOW QUALITY PROTEIN: hypothetical protein PanWU01x14_103770 [Parasponia andersonii]|uniref:Uncharacterized protein n=1 Tax=Parasponia andersonii TaxID=3476 RepID=A0A2P5D279_PARAD|nr:LOW QUALITY PROTEIN: hypothetical protein PanWU01x14_103770 [Parasponia andersonii]